MMAAMFALISMVLLLLLSSSTSTAQLTGDLWREANNFTLSVAILNTNNDEGKLAAALRRSYFLGDETVTGTQFHDMFTPTFETFLNQRVGKTMNPPMKFQTKMFKFRDLNYEATRGHIQLVFGHASVFSCLESAVSMSALATVRKSKLGNLALMQSIRTRSHSRLGVPMNVGGGLIIARRDRYDILTLRDIRGKVVSAVEPSSLLGLQAQWYLLREFGVSLMTEVSAVYMLLPWM